MTWTNAEVDLLHKYPMLSASKLARIIGVSRNAVIGKRNRLGIERVYSNNNIEIDEIDEAKIDNRKKPKRKMKKPDYIFDEPECFLVEIDGAKTLYDVSRNECRFIVLNGCCAKQTNGSSYCSFHHEIIAAKSRAPVS